jgi:hypothetical protein
MCVYACIYVCTYVCNVCMKCYFSKEIFFGRHTVTENSVGDVGLIFLSGTVQNMLVSLEEEHYLDSKTRLNS